MPTLYMRNYYQYSDIRKEGHVCGIYHYDNDHYSKYVSWTP